jgi:hypothetical protein
MGYGLWVKTESFNLSALPSSEPAPQQLISFSAPRENSAVYGDQPMALANSQ